MPTTSSTRLEKRPQSPLLDGGGPRATVLAVASHLPVGVLTNLQLEAMVDTSHTWIMERTGIRQRHRAGSGETTSEMGAAAARVALRQAGDPVIDAIICATCTPDTSVPAAACLIQRRLGLPGNIPAFDINAVCSGYIYGLTVARSLVETGTARHVLLVAAESLTSLVDYRDRATCVLFGDGAAATVIGATGEGGVVATRWGADGGQAELIFYGPSESPDAAGDGIRMTGRGTFRLAVERLCEMTAGLCSDAGWSVDDVDVFVPHQANLRIIEAAAKRVGIPMDRVVVNVESVGNTSAASIPIALAQAQAEGRLKPGTRVVCAAFGAGTTWGGAALQWTAAPSS
ncbi:MAG: beta-ketoacyl-ACP synthase III [Candidatus Dormibacteria bacterium]